MFLKDRSFQDSYDFSDETCLKAMCAYFVELCFMVSTAGIAGTEVCQFQ